MILLTSCHWCPGLRQSSFKSPLARLGCAIVVVIVLLGQTVTDVGIESSPGPCTHGLQHLWAEGSLETSNLLGLCVHKLGSIMSEIVKSVQILFHRLSPLRQPHELSNLHFHHTRRNIIPPKCGGEAVPGGRGPLWVGGAMMGPPYPSRPLQLMRCILSLELFGHSKETQLLLHGVNPLICLERFQGLLKDR